MPDETNTATATKAPEVVYNIERNGVTGPFVMVEKSRGDEKPPIDPKTREPDLDVLLKGEKYPAPYITKDNFDLWIKWFGIDYVVDTTAARANQWAQRIMEATKEQNNHQFNEATWLQFAPQLQFRGEKLSVLQDQVLDILDKASLIDGSTPEGMKAIVEAFAEANRLKVLIRDKKRSPREAKEAGVTPE